MWLINRVFQRAAAAAASSSKAASPAAEHQFLFSFVCLFVGVFYLLIKADCVNSK